MQVFIVRTGHRLVGTATRALARVPITFSLPATVVIAVGLHWVGSQLNVAATLHKGAAWFLPTLLCEVFCAVGQIAAPLLFLRAVHLRLCRRKSPAEHRPKDEAPTARDGNLLALSWQEFEQVVGRYFASQGHHVEVVGGGGADGGVDLVLRRGGKVWLVQCKRWADASVGVSVVRELYGVICARGAAGGYVVCAGRFTPQASRFALDQGIVLIGAAELSSALRARRARSAPIPVAIDGEMAPQCPRCAAVMVRRSSVRGRFWGCSAYPKCTGTRSTAE